MKSPAPGEEQPHLRFMEKRKAQYLLFSSVSFVSVGFPKCCISNIMKGSRALITSEIIIFIFIF